MVQEIEIEYKTLLTKQEFTTLLHALSFPQDSVSQTNYYFDTINFALKEHLSALRIREKEGKYTLTLKEPHVEGILETHDQLSSNEFEQWINGQPIPKENVTNQLTAMGVIVPHLLFYGSLYTERRSFTEDGIIYVLDKSSYNNITDYELEIEAPSKIKGKEALRKILEKFPVVEQKSITKIERFFTTLP